MSADPRLALPPLLLAPYAEALAQCATSLLARYDVLAIVACGTVVRGVADARSDLDVHVVHRGAFRQRLQEIHHGVPCEVFVNPPERFVAYFEEERRDRRPITSHMLATGVLVFDPDGVGAGLQARASDVLADPPPAAEAASLVQARYGAATLMEDALDLQERDPEGAALVLSQAVRELAECRLLAEPGWLPRPKDVMRRLREADPEAARLAVAASSESALAARIEAGRLLCVRVTGAEGFFEWASPQDPAEDEPTRAAVQGGRLMVLCGLPGSGKTMLARQLEREMGAIRLCPDEWMPGLAMHLWDEAARTRVEALQWRLALGWLALGHTVVIEWGTWGRSERDALREGARALGAAVELRFLDAPLEELFARVQRRGMEEPTMTMAQMRDYDALIQRPTPEEMALFDSPTGS